MTKSGIAEAERLRGLGKTPGPGSEYANVVREVRKHRNNPSGVACTNPKCVKNGRQAESHDLAHCWHPGGGMAGQKPDWMTQRDKARAATKFSKIFSTELAARKKSSGNSV